MDLAYVIGALAVLLVLLVAAIAALRWNRSRTLRRQFGPEYEHTVRSAGNRRLAERDLQARRDEFSRLELRELDAEQRRELGARWRNLQVDFVDQPQRTIEAADRLLVETMRARGYPDGDFPQRLATTSVEHPEVTSDYRQAREIAERSRRGDATTEDLRRGMVCYRNVFQALLGAEEVPTEPAASAPRRQVRS